ncbi:glycoprotein 3-alpha-L-fucosyltransferase A-like [Brevipalpus obovatus]|uniref:glycoprotein 3-alpha-L-fucosyltransferase A-like n=1 Tax=Brevipalpus obovatus TaxID=246614 RepID=UPI003D9E38B0
MITHLTATHFQRWFSRTEGKMWRLLKTRRVSMLKLWLIMVALMATVFVLFTIRSEIGHHPSIDQKNIHQTSSLGRAIIGRLAESMQMSGQNDENDINNYGVQDGNFIWSSPVRPWFMTNGTLRPDSRNPIYSKLKLWPDGSNDSFSDRIVNQLMFIPHNYDPNILSELGRMKKILLNFDPSGWGGPPLPAGRTVFLQDQCPVNTCELTFNQRDSLIADAVLFKDFFRNTRKRKLRNQVWILYLLECPLHTSPFVGITSAINWTATYRHDSDIVAPYEKFVPFSHPIKTEKPKINYAEGKSKKVAWFVSNCVANNNRLEYAKQLRKYIQVDIYGRCGDKECPRADTNQCFDMLRKDYKFYLAFENSNCFDYITEKFFTNGLSTQVLPIVMGAQKSDYERSAPPNSFIHVDDFKSPKELANYLKTLDANDSLYNKYFEWKGTGEFINTRFWCRLCAQLHAPRNVKSYQHLNSWWNSESTCKLSGGWNS